MEQEFQGVLCVNCYNAMIADMHSEPGSTHDPAIDIICNYSGNELEAMAKANKPAKQ